MEDASTVRPRSGSGRWLLALVLTFALLPLPLARILVGFRIQHQNPNMFFALGAGILIVPFLTVGLADRWRQSARILLVVGMILAWLICSCILAALRTSDMTPWYVLGPALGGSTLWVLWLTWMHAFPRSLFFKSLVFLPLVAWAVGFWQVYDIEGLNGDAELDFVRVRAAVDLDSRASKHETDEVESLPLSLTDSDFPGYLGSDRTGRITGRGLFPDWKQRPPVEVWRKSIGAGWGGFAAASDLVFTQEQRGESECVLCYSLETGEQVWLHADEAAFRSVMAGDGPRATPTITEFGDAPESSQTRVVTVGATGLVNCLDARTGKLNWQVDLMHEHNVDENLVHGICASPLVVDDVVLVCPPGKNGPCLAAYRLADGAPVWSTGSDRQSYSSPMVATIRGQKQIILHAGPGIYGFDVLTGDELWFHAFTNEHDNNAAQPVIHCGGRENSVFASTGYSGGCCLFEIDRNGDAWSANELWKTRNMKTKYCSAVEFEGCAYGLDNGILSCVDLESGKRMWKRGRYGHGQILLVDHLLIIQCENGDLALVKPQSSQLDERARIPMLTAKTWNTLTLAGTRLLVRNDREAVCIQLPQDGS